MSITKKDCNCSHSFQDQLYGKGKRLMNSIGKSTKITGYRCTVCGKEYK